MKQVLLRGNSAFLAEVPKPGIAPGELLVEVHWSCISTGTESAALIRAAAPPPASSKPITSRIVHGAGRAVRLGLKAASQPMRAWRLGGKLLGGGRAGEALARHLADGSTLSEQVVGAPEETQGLPSGYSAAGVVRRTGDGTHGFAVGDRVACVGAGRAHHAEWIAVPANLAVHIPDGVALREASTAALGAIALQGVRRADCRLGECAAVLGLGILGQLTLHMLHGSGVRVFAFDPDAQRVAIAHALGFTHCYAHPADLVRAIRHATGGQGADATVITASSASDSPCQQAMELTRRKGRVVVVGDVGLSLQRAPFYAKEIDFLISCSYGPGRYDTGYEERGGDYPYAYVRWTLGRNLACYLDQLASDAIKVGRLISHEHAIEDAGEAFRELVESSPRPLLTVLRYPVAAGTSQVASQEPVERPPLLTRPCNLVLTGLGAFAEGMLMPHLAALSNQTHWYGVVSARVAHARNVAIAHGIDQVYGDLAAALADEKVGAVVIASRHHLHAGQIAASLDSGRAVFCEKPIALDWSQLEAVDAAVRRSLDGKLMAGFNRRFSAPIRALHGALEHRIGPLIANYRMNVGALPASHWVHGPEGGGRNLGEACHIYDLFGFLTGASPVAISAHAISARGAQSPGNENFIASIRFSDGSLCSLTYTALGDAQLGKERFEVFSDGAAFVLDDYRNLVRHADGKTATLIHLDAADKGHERELAQWANWLVEGGPAVIPWPELCQASAIALWVEDCLNGQSEAAGIG